MTNEETKELFTEDGKLNVKNLASYVVVYERSKNDYLSGRISGMALANRLGVNIGDLMPILDKWDSIHDQADTNS